MKKGIVFSLEALIAITILTSLVTFISVFNVENVSPYKRFERIQLYAKDSLEVMSQITAKDLIDQFPDKMTTLKQQVENGNIENESSIIEAIGTLWSEGYSDAARKVSNETLSLILPKSLSYNLTAGTDDIYSSSVAASASTEVSKSNKIVSGFQPGKPTKGFVARAWLEKIGSKVFSSYLYFGGYVGQGNLTFFINDIPSDANITSAYMEASVDSDFNLYINSELCGLFTKISAGNFPVDNWTITKSSPPNCLEKIIPGLNNKFDINFIETNITKKGIGGGYIKVTYDTDQLSTAIPTTMKYNLTGIDGIINLYDSFYVPGNITNMKMNLDISSHEKVFVSIGNKIVYYNNTSAVIDNTTFSSLLGNDYNFLSQRTVPFRIGHYGITPNTYVTDVVLTTSLVKDMGRQDIPLNSTTNVNITRIQAARGTDINFTNTILSDSRNRVGLVAYFSTINPNYVVGLTNDNQSLINNITKYNNEPCGGQCQGGQRDLCGAIKEARTMLDDPLRKNYILLMSDGSAEKNPQCIDSGHPYYKSCPNATYKNLDGTGMSGTQISAIDEAYYAFNTSNITTYTVGFGPTADNNLLKQIAACGNGTWAASTDYDGLKNIYDEFAKNMLQRSIIYDFQPASAAGVNSTLFPDSYLEFDYTPEVPAYQYGEIALKLETTPFSSGNGCNGSVYIPTQFSVDDIRVSSYSSKLWTQTLSIRNSVYNWEPVFNLTNFGTQYIDLGDPFNIQFSPAFLKSNENNISLVLAKNTTEKSNECSLNNKAFYTVRFSARTVSDVLPKSNGSYVRVYFNRGDFDCNPEDSMVVTVGTPTNNTIIDVDKLDMANNAIHNATSQLLNKLKLNGAICTGPAGNATNPIDIEITRDLKFEISEISNVPSLWGPIKFELTISS